MSTTTSINEKLVQYFNEALAMENAAADRVQQRIEETPLLLARQQLQYHLEETLQQQERLRRMVVDLGGSPTSMKASLPMLLPGNMETISNMVKDAAKSMTSDDDDKKAVDAEEELMQSKQDAIIEGNT